MESVIKWRTGKPKESLDCIATIANGTVKVLTWLPPINSWVYNGLERAYGIIAWCPLSEIKPYKE